MTLFAMGILKNSMWIFVSNVCFCTFFLNLFIKDQSQTHKELEILFFSTNIIIIILGICLLACSYPGSGEAAGAKKGFKCYFNINN